MIVKPIQTYDDAELTGLSLIGQLSREWQSGRHATVAEVTTAVHRLHPELPRSTIFWLAFHAIHPPQE